MTPARVDGVGSTDSSGPQSRAFYEDWYESQPQRPQRDFAAYLILAEVQAQRGRWIDVGCGPGYMIAEVVKGGWSALGVDFSLTALQRGRRNLPGVPFVAADGMRLPFRAETFDRASALGTLEHFPDPGTGAAEVARVLKPDGRALILVPNRRFLLWRLVGRSGTEQRANLELLLTMGEWRSLIERAGFVVEAVHKDPWHTKSAGSVTRLIRRVINAILPIVWNYQFLFVCRRR